PHLGGPAARRPGGPAARRPGGPAARRPGGPAVRWSGGPAVRWASDGRLGGTVAVRCGPPETPAIAASPVPNVRGS
ncbi:hypothetical protein AB0I16_30195, partial [Streptomyces sp. NPDC050703]|uniref:hypothetical protein n=1 Tax=Streptomyces sp. NPDC050703 TaxID=3157218 RepID=UPI00341CF647